MKNSIWVKPAETEEQKLEAFRIRHKVFVEEMGYSLPGCTPKTGVREAADKYSRIFVAYDDDKPIGCLSLDWWKEVDIPHDKVKAMQLDVFADSYSRNSVFVTRKAVVLPEYRSSSAFWKLIMALASFAFVLPGPHFVFTDCAPELVCFYIKLGFRAYAPAFRYNGEGGLSVPMCAVMNDLDYLKEIKATLRIAAVAYNLPHLPGIEEFFNNTWPSEQNYVHGDRRAGARA